MNFFALAGDLHEARRVATHHFDALDFDVRAFEDLEPVERRLESRGVNEELLERVTELSRTTVVVHDVFHVYQAAPE